LTGNIVYNEGMKTLKDGKTTTLTIKITQKTRDRAQALYEKLDSNMTFSSFLGEMVIKGLVLEEILREKEQKALAEFAKNAAALPGSG
jgi:hypothetical protein